MANNKKKMPQLGWLEKKRILLERELVEAERKQRMYELDVIGFRARIALLHELLAESEAARAEQEPMAD